MFNDERRKNASFIFEKMKRYYPTFETPDEMTIGEWVGVLDGYSQTEIMDALKAYRKNVPYNVAPLPAKFKEYLPEKHHHVEPEAEKKELPSPENLMALDVKTGDCRNNLYVYRDAFEICLHEFLPEVVPVDVAERAYYPRDVQLAVENGVFGRFGEAMLLAAQRRFERDYEFPSKNDLAAMKEAGQKVDSSQMLRMTDTAKNLASHWRVA
jgi:hypothetical protein